MKHVTYRSIIIIKKNKKSGNRNILIHVRILTKFIFSE
jgi:hypothetical protein